MKFTAVLSLAASAAAYEQSQYLNLVGTDTVVYLAEMIGVFMGELVYLNRLSSIEDCALGAPPVLEGAKEVVDLILAGDEIKAISKATTVAALMSNEVKTCKGSPEEIMALSRWFMDKAGSK